MVTSNHSSVPVGLNGMGALISGAYGSQYYPQAVGERDEQSNDRFLHPTSSFNRWGVMASYPPDMGVAVIGPDAK